MVLPKGQTCLGVHQVDKVADAKVGLKLGFLGGRQGTILVFDGSEVPGQSLARASDDMAPIASCTAA